jgi:hypothetical protein
METEKTIVVPRDKPISERLRTAGVQVRAWLKSMDQPMDDATEELRLIRYVKKRDSYHYSYGLLQKPEKRAFRVTGG